MIDLSNSESKLRWLGWLLHGIGLLSVALTAITVREATIHSCVYPRQRLEAEAVRLTPVLATAGTVFQEHRRVQQELGELENNTRAMRDRIPDQPQEAEYLSALSKVAQEVEFSIDNYERQASTAAPSHTEFDVRVEGNGSYVSFCRFLDRIHQLPRIAVVKRLTVNARDKSTDYPFDMVLTLFYRNR